MSDGEHLTGLEIAVIGMAGRFPSAKDLDEFLENLKNGVESITYYGRRELVEGGVEAVLLENPDYVRSGGSILENKEYFDPVFFGHTPAEAGIMDPQVRIFLEVTWQALEDAGYHAGAYDGLIGVYAGASANFTWEAYTILSGKREGFGEFAAVLLADRDHLCTRISYDLGLKGPGVVVKTACSTSLAAVHTACQAVLNGECDMALAGGVTIGRFGISGYLYREGMILSPDGHCRAFDARAGGTVGGEGAGVVVLKRLTDAVNDRDFIHAVIKATAINNDGERKVGYTAPSVIGQAEVIRCALHMADINPESITYIETHGTGTIMGDSIEIEALKMAFNSKKRGFCRIGSVKTNVGHLDSAAGIAGLIKAILALKHRFIPPTLHFENPNPAIDFDNSPFIVNRELTGWERVSPHQPLRAGVSSFGIGGTNAHVILEEAPGISGSAGQFVSASAGQWDSGSVRMLFEGTRVLAPLPNRQFHLILLSAKTKTALETMTRNLAAHFRKYPGINLADAAYTLQVGRGVFRHRRTVVCTGGQEAVQALSADDSRKVHTFYTRNENPDVIFIFPGQGAQYVNMGRGLYETEPVFREQINRCIDILRPLVDYDLTEILYPPAGGHKSYKPYRTYIPLIHQIETAQPMIFAFEYALAKLLISWGIEPGAMIGYSLGEYTAACLAGVFSFEEVLDVLVFRARLISGLPGGSMISVPLPAVELKDLLPGELSLAIDNGSSCIAAGSKEAVDRFEKQMKTGKCICTPVPHSHALHSRMMAPILPVFRDKLKSIKLNPPQIPYISNVTGDWSGAGQAADPDYWCRHLEKTVQFAAGIERLVKESASVFLEIGPGRDLSALVSRYLDESSGQYVMNLVRPVQLEVSDIYYLVNKIGWLWLYGVQPDWTRVFSSPGRRRVPLPLYPFEGQRYWLEDDPFKGDRPGAMKPAGTRKKPDVADWFYLPYWRPGLLLPGHGRDTGEDSGWLVFTNDLPFNSCLVRRLLAEGKQVITVEAGAVFNRRTPDRYTINPQESGHYRLLLEELREQDQVPGVIIHLWGITAYEPGELNKEILEAAQDLGISSLLYLVQALSQPFFSRTFTIYLVFSGVYEITGQESLAPEKAPVLGLARVIPQELSNITCRCVDILLPGPGSVREDQLLDHLVKEFHSDSGDMVMAYRRNCRWVEIFHSLRLEDDSRELPQLKERGVYLITGGLGNVGFILSRYLAGAFKARLVLTGLTSLPPRDQWPGYLSGSGQDPGSAAKIKKVMELEASGAEVLVFNADAADERAMGAVVMQAEQWFGSINGIIHAALKGRDTLQPVISLSKAQFRQQFQAKVYGALVLEKLFRNKPLDFCLLISTPASILGGLGLAAYAAANIFLDAFVYHHNRDLTPPGIPWTTVNWGDWQGEENIGKNAKNGDRQKIHGINQKLLQGVQGDGFLEKSPPGRRRQKNGGVGESVTSILMSPHEGIKTFQRILKYCRVPQVIVSAGDWHERFNKWIKLETLKERGKVDKELAVPLKSRPPLMNEYEPPVNPIQETLVKTWENMFGYKGLGISDDFFELGGDSLLAVQTVARINQEFHIQLSSHILLRQTTVRDLAEIIGKAVTGEGPPGISPGNEPGATGLLSPLLVEIQGGDSRNQQPIFLVHAVGGHVYQYRDLAAALGGQYPVYGLQSSGLDGKSEPLTSLPEIAGQYIREIYTVQPHGPYLVGGASFGGMAAFEIARQLVFKCRETILPFMMDTPEPGYLAPGLEDDAGILALIAHHKGQELTLSAEQIREMTPMDQCRFLMELGWIPGDQDPGAALRQVQIMKKVFRANCQAQQHYKPGSYPGKVIFFRPTYQGLYNAANPRSAWANLAAKGLIIHDVPGNHHTMTQFPHVQSIADILKSYILDLAFGDQGGAF